MEYCINGQFCRREVNKIIIPFSDFFLGILVSEKNIHVSFLEKKETTGTYDTYLRMGTNRISKDIWIAKHSMVEMVAADIFKIEREQNDSCFCYMHVKYRKLMISFYFDNLGVLVCDANSKQIHLLYEDGISQSMAEKQFRWAFDKIIENNKIK